MSAITERLTPLDATFLELEQADEGAMMHIGGALIFDPRIDTGAAPSLDELCTLLDERFGALRRFHCRLSEQRVHGLRRPNWVHDPSFDLRAHVRHATLPAPGGEAEVHEWLSDFWSHRLDRSRPLWEMTLVDGLADGCWMLATKTHHAMVDGVGSIDIGHILLDVTPTPERSSHPDTAAASDNGDLSGNGHINGLPGTDLVPIAVGAARGALGAVLHPHRLVRAGEAAVAMGEVLWQDEILAARPTTLNVPIGTTRRFASVALDLGQIKAVKAALGGTVNDVVLAVAAGALRRMLEHRGEDLELPLRAMVPVNLRGEDDGSLGNRVTSLFVELPVGEPDRGRRYAQTRAAATALKSGTAALGGSTIVLVAGVTPPLVHETIARMLFAPRLFNLTITNVPGAQMPLYALGSRMRRIVPLVPLFADHSVGMAIVSYDGELVFGINADYATTPDLDVLSEGLRQEFDGLLALAGA
jgi:diacylglycerol O-acyltransferase